VIRAFIYVLKRVLYSVVSRVGLYINMRVKAGRKVRVIRRYISTAIYIALPRLYKGRAVPRALIQRLIIISNYSLVLEGVRELKLVLSIIYIGRRGVIGTARAV
jgi:hypothetical protein